MSSTRYDAVVIGAGSNGLVAAAALARAGRRVLVLERSGEIGGQSRAIEIAPGFRAPLSADTGWVPPTVARGLGLSAPAVTLPSSSVTIAQAGGFVALPCDAADAAEIIRKYSSRDAGRWGPLVGRLHKLARFLGALYEVPPPDVDTTAVGDVASMIGLGRRFRALGRTDMTELLRVLPMAIHELLNDELECDWLKAAVGAGGVRDIRQGPRSGGTSFVLLHYLIGAPPGSVRARSWWRNGPDDFVAAADAIARRHGATIRTGAGVARIVVADDAVSGVALDDGEEISAPLVISTADPTQTLLGLVDPVWLDPDLLLAVRNIKHRGCTAIVQYALDRLPAAPGLGAAELSGVVTLTESLDALERAYDAAKYGGFADAEKLHVEIYVPSLRWPSLAPPGKHAMNARVSYVPYRLRNGEWNAERSRVLGESVTATIARAIPGFCDAVLHQSVLTPADLEERFAVTEGALTHGELTLDQVLFMRPIAGFGRYAMPIAGLYLGGAGAHPGPGVLGGAGWLAAKAALSSGPTQRA